MQNVGLGSPVEAVGVAEGGCGIAEGEKHNSVELGCFDD